MKIIVFSILLISLISADVMYEMESKSEGMMEMIGGETVIRNFIKGDRMRTEIKTKNLMLGELKSFTITRLDKGLIWLLDDEKKEYTEVVLNSNILKEDTDTGGIVPEIKIEKMAETKKILNIDCQKYVITFEISTNDNNLKIVQTMWIANNFAGCDEIVSFNKKMPGTSSELNIIGINKNALREFQQKVSEIEGFPLEIEFCLNKQESDSQIDLKVTSKITKISTVPISNKVFEIPEGYKAVNILNNN